MRGFSVTASNPNPSSEKGIYQITTEKGGSFGMGAWEWLKKQNIMTYKQKNTWVRQMNSKRNIFFMVLHCTLIIVFMFLEFSKIGRENDYDCYTKFFGMYISYSIFNTFWNIYGLVGNFLFGVFRKKITTWQFILLETIWIILIYINWKVYTCL